MSETESEQIIRFIQSVLIIYACLAYTYAISKIVPPGKVRSLFISPVVALFLLLPLRLTSVTLCSGTGLFISWVANFKLALFSVGKGPLASDYQTITFSRFLAVGSLPIILSSKSKMKAKMVDNIDHDSSMKARVFAVKILLFALIYKLLKFEAQLHPAISFYMYGVHIVLSLEFFVFGCRAIVEALLGLELEPQFNEPILSSSVQNFWGQRWNLAVGNILRVSVYDPVRATLSPHVGSKHAQRLGVLATFGVSGAMHEIIFFYLVRKRPTSWDMMGYFLLHGVTVVVETEVKRQIRQKWRLPRLVSILLTLSFMAVTGFLVFSPKFYHCNEHVRVAEDQFAPFVLFLHNLTSIIL